MQSRYLKNVFQWRHYLAQVGDNQGWVHNAEGGHLNGRPVEVAKVSKQRLHSCAHKECNRALNTPFNLQGKQSNAWAPD